MNSATSQQLYDIPQRPVPGAQAELSQLDKLEKYKTRNVKLGKAEIVLGGAIFVLGLVLLIVAFVHDPGQGMWCGAVLIASGITSVAIHSRLPHRIYVANMAVSMIAAFFMVALVVYSSKYASYYAEYAKFLEVALESMNAVLGFIAFLITVMHFRYSYTGACDPYGLTEMMTSVQMSNGQVALFANQTAVSFGTENPAMVMPNQEPVPAQSADSAVPPPYDRL